jgi:hypothetical protein
MTQRYVHPHEEKLRNAAKGIDSLFNATPEGEKRQGQSNQFSRLARRSEKPVNLTGLAGSSRGARGSAIWTYLRRN